MGGVEADHRVVGGNALHTDEGQAIVAGATNGQRLARLEFHLFAWDVAQV